MNVPIEFSEITRISKKDIPFGFLSGDHPPGTMFILDSDGALVKLTRSGFFLTLNISEAIGTTPVKWPNSNLLVEFGGSKLVVRSR